MEPEDSCRAWKEEYQLEFPVITDGDGRLFRAFTNGWVPWSVLVGPDGLVIFSENEFDEAGFANAIRQMYEQPALEKPTRRRVSASARRTVILGGGTGGLVAAHELRRRLPSDQRVVLADRSANHTYQPSLLWQMVGQRLPGQFRRPLQRLERKGIEFRMTEVEELDVDNRVVATTSGDLDYDSLVISLGAELAPEQVEGFDQMAGNLIDPRTLHTDHEGVFAIGDVATIKLPNGKALPKAGVFAHSEANVVARQIADDADGRKSDATFEGRGYCWIELGDGRAGRCLRALTRIIHDLRRDGSPSRRGRRR